MPSQSGWGSTIDCIPWIIIRHTCRTSDNECTLSYRCDICVLWMVVALPLYFGNSNVSSNSTVQFITAALFIHHVVDVCLLMHILAIRKIICMGEITPRTILCSHDLGLDLVSCIPLCLYCLKQLRSSVLPLMKTRVWLLR